jgi:hypothetical protein
VSKQEVLASFKRWHQKTGALPTYMESRNVPELPGPAAVRTALDAAGWAEVRKIVEKELGLKPKNATA